MVGHSLPLTGRQEGVGVGGGSDGAYWPLNGLDVESSLAVMSPRLHLYVSDVITRALIGARHSRSHSSFSLIQVPTVP